MFCGKKAITAPFLNPEISHIFKGEGITKVVSLGILINIYSYPPFLLLYLADSLSQDQISRNGESEGCL